MTLGGNRDGARRVLAEVVGLTAWGAALGYGSFVTIEFGKEVADRSWRPGEWHLGSTVPPGSCWPENTKSPTLTAIESTWRSSCPRSTA